MGVIMSGSCVFSVFSMDDYIGYYVALDNNLNALQAGLAQKKPGGKGGKKENIGSQAVTRETEYSLVAEFGLPLSIDDVASSGAIKINIKAWLATRDKAAQSDQIVQVSTELLATIFKYISDNKLSDQDKVGIVWILAKILYKYPLAIMFDEPNKPSAFDIFEKIAPVTITGKQYDVYAFLLTIYDWAKKIMEIYIADLKAGRTYQGLCQDLDYVTNYPLLLKNFIEKSTGTGEAFNAFKKDVETRRAQVISLMKEADWNNIRNKCSGTVVLPTIEDYQEITEKEPRRLLCGMHKGSESMCFVPFLNDLYKMYQYGQSYGKNGENFKDLNPLIKQRLKDKFLSDLNKLIAFLAKPVTCYRCIAMDLRGELDDQMLRYFTMKNDDLTKIRIYAAYPNKPEQLVWLKNTNLNEPDLPFIASYQNLKKLSEKEYFDDRMQGAKAFLEELIKADPIDKELARALKYLELMKELNIAAKTGFSAVEDALVDFRLQVNNITQELGKSKYLA